MLFYAFFQDDCNYKKKGKTVNDFEVVFLGFPFSKTQNETLIRTLTLLLIHIMSLQSIFSLLNKDTKKNIWDYSKSVYISNSKYKSK